MDRRMLSVLLIVICLVGFGGAVLSVGMIISAVQFCEWGRVVLYCFAAAICVEMAVLAIAKLRALK